MNVKYIYVLCNRSKIIKTPKVIFQIDTKNENLGLYIQYYKHTYFVPFDSRNYRCLISRNL